MFHSAESRWFFEGEAPAAVRAWFDSAGTARAEPARTDAYLVLPGCATAGVKIRAGNLEVKAMTHASEPVTYASGVSGYRDAWVKWSCEADAADALRRMLGAGGERWAAVSKARRLRLVSMASGSPVEVDDPAARISSGCQFELTEIGVSTGALTTPPPDRDDPAADRWWSLSLEAFAHGATDVTEAAMAHLAEAANHLFREPPPCPLDAAHARAYPAWLLQFA